MKQNFIFQTAHLSTLQPIYIYLSTFLFIRYFSYTNHLVTLANTRVKGVAQSRHFATPYATLYKASKYVRKIAKIGVWRKPYFLPHLTSISFTFSQRPIPLPSPIYKVIPMPNKIFLSLTFRL